MGPRSTTSPNSPVNRSISVRTRSTTPAKVSPAPAGHWTGTGRAPSRSRISSSTRAKSAPTRSILFTRHTRGTR